MDHIRYLDISTNRLTGVFPGSLGQMAELVHLSAHSNGLAGEVPADALSKLSKLNYLNLKHNSLRGKGEDLPIAQLPELRYVNMRHNLLDGGMPYRNVTEPFPSLVHLDLASNQLDGDIPSQWFHGTTSLRYLSLQDNR